MVVCLVLAAAISPSLGRGTWYDRYEEALAALDGGDSARAVELLEAALAKKKRTGYLRTYGNHYIRYVPQFYLGVAHHDAGDCETALAWFERSEAAGETEPVPELAARLSKLRGDCEAILAPPPPVIETRPEPVEIPAEEIEESEPPPPPVDPRLDPLEGGLRAYLDGDLDEAVRRFEELARITPDSASARLLLGTALYGSWVVGGRTDEKLLTRARRELTAAARLDPDLEPDPRLCPPSVTDLYASLR
jgi:tetratricopeptide (TPR) repeat protein